MRLRRHAALALCFALCSASPLRAQWSVSPAVALGVAVPAGALADAVGEGVALKAGLWMRAPRVPVGFTIEGMYAHFGHGASTVGGERVSLSGLTANVTTRRHDRRLDLYGVAGGGWYWMHGSREPFPERQAPGLNIGVGEVVALGAADYFVELRVHAIRPPSRSAPWKTFMPLVLGVRF